MFSDAQKHEPTPIEHKASAQNEDVEDKQEQSKYNYEQEDSAKPVVDNTSQKMK